ncbi:MAG: PilZ domain-containing protein [Deltaproteobacteria bacterium]|nr:PilZ domain-containing protein [Deltaproteobacteria bacterium]
MDTTENIDRRRHLRFNCLSLTSLTPHKDGIPLQPVTAGRTLDISRGGASVEVYGHIPQGTEVVLEIGVKERIVRADALVVHSSLSPEGTYTTGLRFTHVAPEDLNLLESHAVDAEPEC